MKAKVKKPAKQIAKKEVSKNSLPVFQIFTSNSLVLQLIIIAFLALSSLMVLHVVAQQKVIDFYKSAEARSVTK